MDTNDIQTRVNSIAALMLAKGLPQPVSSITIKSDEQITVGGEWKDSSQTYGTAYNYFRGDTADEAAALFVDFIEAMPEPEQRKLNEFMGALGKVIDLGRERGIEVGFVNPLVETMKKLSENALTYQKSAAE